MALRDAERQPVGWGLWFGWVLATTMAEAMKWFLGESASEWEAFVVGTSVGLMQWLVLRRHIPVARWFVLATGFGLVFGLELSIAILGKTQPIIVGAVAGAMVGAAQWSTMRRDASRLSEILNPSGIDKAIEEGQWIAPPVLWVLATTAGVAAGLAVLEVLPRAPLWLGYSTTNTVESLMGTIMVGASVGLAQWLVLRRRIPEARWWVWATLAGVAVGFTMVERPAIVALGTSVGLAQWVVLRRHIPEVRWWVLATALGFALGYFADSKLPTPLYSNAVVGNAVSMVVMGTAVGSMQWVVLRRQIHKGARWVLASAGGLSVGFASVDSVGRAVGGDFEGYARGIFGTAASLAVYGMITGVTLIGLCNATRTSYNKRPPTGSGSDSAT